MPPKKRIKLDPIIKDRKVYPEEENDKTTLYRKCKHDWERGPDQGIDEHPEKICRKCGLIY
tara:strand:+ start:313 stop:495 length:183 start_codon:yes stop_codon:yes gene_type:complete